MVEDSTTGAKLREQYVSIFVELDLIDYTKWGRYRIRLSNPDLNKEIEFITDLLKKAYSEATS